MSTLSNTRWPAARLLASRPEVLDGWKTGRQVEDLEEAIAYQAAIPQAKRFSIALRVADPAGETLVQPRAGVCLVKEHINLLQALEQEGQADLLPTTIDSYTRHNRYADAQAGE